MRDRRAAACSLASMAMMPMAFLVSATAASFFVSQSAMNEATFSVLLLVAGASIPVTILFGAAWMGLSPRGVASYSTAGFAAVLGMVISPLLLVLSRTNLLAKEPAGWVVIGLAGAVTCGLLLPHGIAWVAFDAAPRRIHVALAAATGIALVPSLYFWPDISYLARRRDGTLSPLQRIGARRIAGSRDATMSAEARRRLARDGDPSALQTLEAEVHNGKIELFASGNVDILIERGRGGEALRSALLRRLTTSLAVGRGDPEIDFLCRALGRLKEARGVPLFVATYRKSVGNANLREAGIAAIVAVGDATAIEFAVQELPNMQPTYDDSLAKKLSSLPDSRVQRAYEAYLARRSTVFKRSRLRNVKPGQLAEQEESEELLRRALDPNSPDHPAAALQIIRQKHPRRFEVFRVALPRIHFRGQELRGLVDSEFAKDVVEYAAKGKALSANATNFLARWAPSEATPVLERALYVFKMNEAAKALAKIGGIKAQAILVKRAKSLTPRDATLEVYVLAAIGKTRAQNAVGLLAERLKSRSSQPALGTPGKFIYREDVAAYALATIGTPDAIRAVSGYAYRGNKELVAEWCESLDK